jgi:hypothetical protein
MSDVASLTAPAGGDGTYVTDQTAEEQLSYYSTKEPEDPRRPVLQDQGMVDQVRVCRGLM